jgi:hypothetical protein
MLFLNWGNEGNRQRIRDGNGWSDEHVGRALRAHPARAKFLQGVLDTINSLYPEVAKLHEKRTGLKLGKVEAVPISVNGEEYAGGYFPLKYRPDLSRAGELQEGDVVKSLFAPNYVPADDAEEPHEGARRARRTRSSTSRGESSPRTCRRWCTTSPMATGSARPAASCSTSASRA